MTQHHILNHLNPTNPHIKQEIAVYEGGSSQTGTFNFNFTGIKRDASVAVLHTVVSGK
jgi:hypothetical protein